MGDAEERVYHRLASSTQTEGDTEQQLTSGEIWGRPSVWSNFPKVKAYSGPLPQGRAGIEFRTSVPPDPGGAPGRPEWSGPRPGVTVEEGVAKLVCVITKVVTTRPETSR
jgi:hypothetical protein